MSGFSAHPRVEKFCFFFQKEALAVPFCLRAAAPPTPRAVILKKEPKNFHSL
jgi:hypothetical protein